MSKNKGAKMRVNKIFIASDHAGFEAKEQAKKALAALGYEAVDLGTHSAEASVDYPDFAGVLADKILAECEARARDENFKESSGKNSAAGAENSNMGGNGGSENSSASMNGIGNFNGTAQHGEKDRNFNAVKSGDGKNFDADANTAACTSVADGTNASKDKILNSTDYGIYGVLICGTGIGISIAANRRAHVRCALCHDATSARLAREHNDANVLAFGARLMGALEIEDMIKVFFGTDFAGGRHKKRVDKLALNCGADGTTGVATGVCGAGDEASSCDRDLAHNCCEQNSAQGAQGGNCASKISPNESGDFGSNFKTGGGR